MASLNEATQSSLGSTEAAGLAKPAPSQSKPPLTLFRRVQLGFRLWFFKLFLQVMIGTLRITKASKMKEIAPTYTKKYPIRPMLECRIFIPQSYNSKIDSKLPLFIDIHGGGFALCDPQIDDSFCHHFANTHNFCVVSINYRKAPSYYFPTPVHDAAELARAVLADDELPVDYSRVAIGGFSAGGNLTLAIAQLPGIKEKVQALVPVYPVVDFTDTYRGVYRKNKEGKRDLLEDSGPLFTWGYVPANTNRKDTLLSPIFASRNDLPQRIFFIGAEYDVLCHEAEIMAKKLAGKDGGKAEEQNKSNWSENGIKWVMVPDEQHGFTHMQKKGEAEIKRKQVCDDLYTQIADWLKS